MKKQGNFARHQEKKIINRTRPRMTHMLGLSDRDFEITMTMLQNLVENVDKMHKQVSNFNRNMKTIKKKKPKGNSEMKNYFYGLTCRVETAQGEKPVNLNIIQQKLFNLKHKWEKEI